MAMQLLFLGLYSRGLEQMTPQFGLFLLKGDGHHAAGGRCFLQGQLCFLIRVEPLARVGA